MRVSDSGGDGGNKRSFGVGIEGAINGRRYRACGKSAAIQQGMLIIGFGFAILTEP